MAWCQNKGGNNISRWEEKMKKIKRLDWQNGWLPKRELTIQGSYSISLSGNPHQQTYLSSFVAFLYFLVIFFFQSSCSSDLSQMDDKDTRGTKTNVASWHCHPESFCASGKFLCVTLEFALGSFRTVWKISRWSGYFPDGPESFCTAWEVSG